MSQTSSYWLQALLVLLIGFAGLYILVESPAGRPVFFEPWGVFHNYLGSKYVGELGPFDFYACAYAADQEGRKLWTPATLMRDLHTYQLVPARTLQCPRDKFSPERWKEFSHDVFMLTSTGGSGYWGQVVTDKGYNATPFWSVVFGGVANVLPLDNGFARELLFNMDLVAIALTVLIVWGYEGVLVALLTLFLALIYFGSYGKLAGNYFQYAWLPFLALSIGAWRKKQSFLSGGALGLASAIHAFPLFFAVPIVVRGAFDFMQSRKDVARQAARFLGALILTGLFCIAIGSMSSRGFGAWIEWKEKITVHSAYLHGEILNLGLPTLVATLSSPDRGTTIGAYVSDIPHTEARLAAFAKHQYLWYLGAALFLFGLLAAVAFVPSESVFVLGFIPLFALLSLSPYYYLDLALVPYMTIGMPKRSRTALLLVLVTLLMLAVWYWGGTTISFSYPDHLITNLLLGAYVLLLVAAPLWNAIEHRYGAEG